MSARCGKHFADCQDPACETHYGALTDEDRAALSQEFDAFRRGLSAGIRLLERETPLAVGSIAKLRDLRESLAPTDGSG